RGVIVPIIDLRCRFGQGLTEATPLHIVIIVQIGSRPVGLLAHRVLGIVSLDTSRIQPGPRIARGGRAVFLSGRVPAGGALIDLSNLLMQQFGDESEPSNPKSTASAQRR